jgi:hypothetical protein
VKGSLYSSNIRIPGDNARVKGHLRQVDFLFNGHDLRGIEQNPGANNRWAALVRSGKKVAQFLSDGRYVASVVDGKVTRFI